MISCLFHWMKKFFQNVVCQRKENASRGVNCFLFRVDPMEAKMNIAQLLPLKVPNYLNWL